MNFKCKDLVKEKSKSLKKFEQILFINKCCIQSWTNNKNKGKVIDLKFFKLSFQIKNEKILIQDCLQFLKKQMFIYILKNVYYWPLLTNLLYWKWVSYHFKIFTFHIIYLLIYVKYKNRYFKLIMKLMYHIIITDNLALK